MPNKDHFQGLAEEFDRFTRFDERIVSERPVFEALRSQYGWRRVVDAGCGSGLHAVLLAQLGVDVVGVDISEAMLAQAQKNAERLGVSIRFVHSDLAEAHLDGGFDAVISLGNVFALVLGPESLAPIARQVRSWLRPGGNLLVQMLNFERILSERRRLIAANEIGDTIYIRYYDISEPLLRFNMLRLHNGEPEPGSNHTSTDHYPWRRSELLPVLERYDLSTEFWGDLQQTPYELHGSNNLVAFATRR